MLVRPFSDLHAEFWQPNKITRILEMVVPPLPTDQETVAQVAGDIQQVYVIISRSSRFFSAWNLWHL